MTASIDAPFNQMIDIASRRARRAPPGDKQSLARVLRGARIFSAQVRQSARLESSSAAHPLPLARRRCYWARLQMREGEK